MRRSETAYNEPLRYRDTLQVTLSSSGVGAHNSCSTSFLDKYDGFRRRGGISADRQIRADITLFVAAETHSS